MSRPSMTIEIFEKDDHHVLAIVTDHANHGLRSEANAYLSPGGAVTAAMDRAFAARREAARERMAECE